MKVRYRKPGVTGLADVGNNLADLHGGTFTDSFSEPVEVGVEVPVVGHVANNPHFPAGQLVPTNTGDTPRFDGDDRCAGCCDDVCTLMVSTT